MRCFLSDFEYATRSLATANLSVGGVRPLDLHVKVIDDSRDLMVKALTDLLCRYAT